MSSMSRAPEAATLDAPETRHTLAAAEAIVVVDPYILSGTPVFRGTRIPVHDIAAMQEHDTLEQILEGYPALTAEMVALAKVYAAAHPAEDRPVRRIPDMFPGAVLLSERWQVIEATLHGGKVAHLRCALPP
jgi:uncharacterized protein (DUF433 family)